MWQLLSVKRTIKDLFCTFDELGFGILPRNQVHFNIRAICCPSVSEFGTAALSNVLLPSSKTGCNNPCNINGIYTGIIAPALIL